VARDRTVLVVDDDHAVREAVADALDAAGYRVRQAVHGKDALQQLRSMDAEPCLVLLDMMMPEMNGAEFLAALKDAPTVGSLPVVVISAEAITPGEARRYLRKPVSLETLLRVVEEYCGAP
jgi:CheY-like chemotaxis protein